MAVNTKTKKDVENELALLKKTHDTLVRDITDMVMDHDSCDGCTEGKLQFLQDLGLEPPVQTYRVTVDLEVLNSEWSASDIKTAFVDGLTEQGGYYNYDSTFNIDLGEMITGGKVVSVETV
jgi:hypothetical protein